MHWRYCSLALIHRDDRSNFRVCVHRKSVICCLKHHVKLNSILTKLNCTLLNSKTAMFPTKHHIKASQNSSTRTRQTHLITILFSVLPQVVFQALHHQVELQVTPSGCINVLTLHYTEQETKWLHRNGKVVRVTALVFAGDVEACLQRLQWIPELSPWWPFRFSVPFCIWYFQMHFFYENCCISIKISLKFVLMGLIND